MQFTYSKTSYFPYMPPYYGENNIGPKVITGPASQGILIKGTGGNAIMPTGVPGSSNQAIPKAMPQKFYPSMNDSIFSLARRTYIKDAGSSNSVGNGPFLTNNLDSSAHIKFKKIKAQGKSTLPYNNQISFQGKSNDTTVRNSSLSRVRGGGSVAPKKKGAIRNT
jgi:hypothetical protein